MKLPDLDQLKKAYDVTRGATQTTPLLESVALARETGASRVFVKPESLQWAGSFKIRGAYWRLTQLSQDEAKRGVVAFSSGNFAQGLAAAGQALDIPVTIVMPIDAPEAKREATRGFGAEVVLSDHGERGREDAAAELAANLAKERGLTLLHPFDDIEVVTGQAGAGLEAIDQLGQAGAVPDVILCPVGGGGLIGGVSLAFHYLAPDARIIGVEPDAYAGMGASIDRGEIAVMPVGPKSICDGLMARAPGNAPFEAVRQSGVTGLSVGDKSVRRAMRFAFEKLKLVLEPSGAAGIAALLDHSLNVDGKTVLVIATGGNVSLADFVGHVSHV